MTKALRKGREIAPRLQVKAVPGKNGLETGCICWTLLASGGKASSLWPDEPRVWRWSFEVVFSSVQQEK